MILLDCATGKMVLLVIQIDSLGQGANHKPLSSFLKANAQDLMLACRL
jgi:hypothetical protein